MPGPGSSTTINVNLVGSGNLSLVLSQAGAAAGHAGHQVNSAGSSVEKFGAKAEKMSLAVMRTTGKIAMFATGTVGAAHGAAMLAATAVQLGGALAVVPAVAAAAVIGIQTAKLAVGGLSDAFAASSGDASEYNKALKTLAPSAAKLVKTAVSLKPALLGVRQSVQGGFFRAWAGDVKPLASKWLPMLRVSLSRVSDGMGDAISGVTKWARTSGPLNQVRTVIDNTGIASHNLSGALKPVIAGMLNIVTLGSNRLGGMTEGLTGLTKKFEAWTNSIGDSGKFDSWVDNSVAGFKKLKSMGGNVGRIFSGIFSAAKGTGGSGLDTLGGAIEKIADAVNKPAFKDGMTKIFQGFASAAHDVQAQIPALADALTRLAPTFAAIVSGSGAAFGATLHSWTDIIVTLAPAINGIATGLEPLAPLLGAIVPYLFLGAKAMKLLSIAMNMSPIGRIVTVIALLAAGLVLAWQKSQTFREVMTTVFAGVGVVVLEFVKLSLLAWKGLATAWLWVVGKIVDGAAFAFGWVPGIGGKLKGAKAAFHSFADGVTDDFDSAIGKVDAWQGDLNKMPKVVKFQGEITDLQTKINDAKAKMKTVPKEQRAKLLADIKQWQTQLKTARAGLAGIKGKTVKLNITTIRHEVIKRGNAHSDTRSRDHTGGLASGGPVIGPGTSTSDSVLKRLSTGEHVWTAAEVRAAGGQAAVKRIRKAVLSGYTFKELQQGKTDDDRYEPSDPRTQAFASARLRQAEMARRREAARARLAKAPLGGFTYGELHQGFTDDDKYEPSDPRSKAFRQNKLRQAELSRRRAALRRKLIKAMPGTDLLAGFSLDDLKRGKTQDDRYEPGDPRSKFFKDSANRRREIARREALQAKRRKAAPSKPASPAGLGGFSYRDLQDGQTEDDVYEPSDSRSKAFKSKARRLAERARRRKALRRKLGKAMSGDLLAGYSVKELQRGWLQDDRYEPNDPRSKFFKDSANRRAELESRARKARNAAPVATPYRHSKPGQPQVIHQYNVTIPPNIMASPHDIWRAVEKAAHEVQQSGTTSRVIQLKPR